MTTQRTVEKAYLNQLTYQLQRRGLAPDKIGDILAEVETHVAATGEPARVAFGPPAEYARRWKRRPGLRWPATVGLALIGACGGWALSAAYFGALEGAPTLGLNGWWWLGFGLVLVVFVAAVAMSLYPYNDSSLSRSRKRGREVVATATAILISTIGFGAVIDGAVTLGRGDQVVGLSNGWRMVLGLALVLACGAIIPLVRITDPRTGRPFSPPALDSSSSSAPSPFW